MPDQGPLNLLALPPLHRKIIVHLSREGPADAATLAEALDQDPPKIEQALTALVEKGSLHMAADGRAEVSLGRTRRRKLPARLRPALSTTTRLYSAQELATLRTAMPILRFARARLSEFSDHGPQHALRVQALATQLAYLLDLSATERHLLRAAALFHDVGNVVDRAHHHIISQETVEKLTASHQLPFSRREADLVGLLCRWHRKAYDLERQDSVGNETVRTGLLASILRVADAMDIDHRRSDYSAQFAWVLKFFYPDELPYWTSLEEILGVRIRCRSGVNLQVFTMPQVQDNLQIEMLRQELKDTPLDWTMDSIKVHQQPTAAPDKVQPDKQTALLVFPFEPHSLIMAALSRKQLLSAGFSVELLCYPDTIDGSAWLWGETLANMTPAEFRQLIVINDRAGADLRAQMLAVIETWRAAGVGISLLNRHEATWSNLPDLLRLGVEIILGGDWAYFWGESVSQTDLSWTRMAACCTRDPTQSTVTLTTEEQHLTQGLLYVTFDAMQRPVTDVEGLVSLVEPLLERIADDDRAFFIERSADFATAYTTPTQSGQIEGRVLRFAGQTLGKLPQAYHFALEAAIEQQGRTLERGICFNVPYALATWADDQDIELLAINHWREEEATPIRLLYPGHLGPSPEGNECTLRVRLPREQAEAIVQALIEACNEGEPESRP